MNAVPPNSLFIKKPLLPVTGNARRDLLPFSAAQLQSENINGSHKNLSANGFFL